MKDIDITRHLLKYAPEYIDKETRPVTAIAPGVLGTTGIETMEIIKGIVENIKPKLIIAYKNRTLDGKGVRFACYFIIWAKSSSEITVTPSSCAFLSLLPASSPART